MKEMKVHPPLSSFTVELASPSSMAELTELSLLPCSQPPSLGSTWLRNTNKKENRRAQPLLSRNHRISVHRKRHRFHRNPLLFPAAAVIEFSIATATRCSCMSCCSVFLSSLGRSSISSDWLRSKTVPLSL
ncbi:hypothetical protein PIB30_063240 [Stylosanthes scabra]|uniref:Uncharacterized protein n=1 Tax=Stylosanthes scabra TaxID=79078 RepID=A0ABU6WL53_9FABA|nr:hypothetical protein [Stylosanthes scabra]